MSAPDARARFERLLAPLHHDLYRAALALSGSEADALDLVQEACLRGYRGFGAYREESHFKSWIFTILRNAHVDLRRRRRLEPATLDPGVEPALEAIPPLAAGLEPGAVASALSRLPARQQLLLLLREVQGFSYAEMAEILGWPAGSVMSGLHHARNALARELGAGS